MNTVKRFSENLKRSNLYNNSAVSPKPHVSWVAHARHYIPISKLWKKKTLLGLKRINKPLKRSKNRIPEHVENKIIELTLLNPHGTAIQLMKVLKEHDITTTIQNIWKREQLNTRELRIKRSQSINIEV